MNRRLLALCAMMCAVCVCSCGEYVPEDVVDIKDELKISAYLLGEEFEDNGYWAYSDDLQYMNQGYWVSDDGRQYEDDEVFALERLEVGEVRTLAPLCYFPTNNLTLFFEFEGTIEVSCSPDDDTIRLAHCLEYPLEPWTGGLGRLTYSNNIQTRAPFALEVYPIGKFTNGQKLLFPYTLTDREYYLDIRAYTEDGDLLVSAKIKLVALADEHFPSEQFSGWVFAANEEKTRFLSIELVSYEYSDIYKLDESMYEEE